MLTIKHPPISAKRAAELDQYSKEFVGFAKEHHDNAMPPYTCIADFLMHCALILPKRAVLARFRFLRRRYISRGFDIKESAMLMRAYELSVECAAADHHRPSVAIAMPLLRSVIDSFINKPKGKRDALIFLLLCFCNATTSELENLRVSDIRTDERGLELTFRRHLVRKTLMRKGRLKRDESPYCPVRLWKEYKATLPPQPSQPVFPRRYVPEEPLAKPSIVLMVSRRLKKAGVELGDIRALKRGVALEVLKRGLDAFDFQRQLGYRHAHTFSQRMQLVKLAKPVERRPRRCPS